MAPGPQHLSSAREMQSCGQTFIVTPTTSYPSDFNSAAVTDESTPPDMATTTLMSCGRPSRSRLLSIGPIVAAITAIVMFAAIKKPLCGQTARMR